MWGMVLGVPISVYIYRQLVVGMAVDKKCGQSCKAACPEAAETPAEGQ
jgi:hypothetical protein